MRGAAPAHNLTSENPLDVLEADHDLQELLCDNLEKIADGLPDCLDNALCLKSIRFLKEKLPIHHLDEEQGLFPLLLKKTGNDDELSSQIEQLKTEHATDEGFAEEIIDCLQSLIEGGQIENPEMCGYMMRGFFESYRRHIRWEQSVLMPIARRLLNDSELISLAATMAANREESKAGS